MKLRSLRETELLTFSRVHQKLILLWAMVTTYMGEGKSRVKVKNGGGGGEEINIIQRSVSRHRPNRNRISHLKLCEKSIL